MLRFLPALIKVVSQVGQRHMSEFWLLIMGLPRYLFFYSVLSGPGLEVDGGEKNKVNE